MNTLMLTILFVGLPAYALLWHNQPARRQKEEKSAIEAAFTFLLNPTWLAKIPTLAARFVFPSIARKWLTAKIHAYRQRQCNQTPQTFSPANKRLACRVDDHSTIRSPQL
jgi:hypothetical protein